MILTIVAAVLTALSVGIGYYLTDRSCLRKIILFIGIIGIGLSLWQGYRSQQKLTVQITELERLTNEESTLEREVGLRHIDGKTFLSIIGDNPKGEFEIVYGAEDPDSVFLAHNLRDLLETAGWKFISITAFPLATLLDLKK